MQRIPVLSVLLCLTGLLSAARGDPPPSAAGLPPGASAVIPLWPQGAPGSASHRAEPETIVNGNVTNVHNPSVTVFLPAPGHRTGAGVIVMPGGGHRDLVIQREGYDVARWLTAHGIAAFVLKYRLAKAPDSIYRVEVEELADARRSVRLVRSRASEWAVDPKRVGVMGFAAGGELAALAAMQYDLGRSNAPDPVERQSSKPAFQALIYPDGAEDIAVNVQSPPAFLVAGYDDRPEISQGIARAYLLFQNVGVSAELHIYAGVGHGFGVQPGPAESWAERFRAWLEYSGLLNGR